MIYSETLTVDFPTFLMSPAGVCIHTDGVEQLPIGVRTRNHCDNFDYLRKVFNVGIVVGSARVIRDRKFVRLSKNENDTYANLAALLEFIVYIMRPIQTTMNKNIQISTFVRARVH